MNHKESTFKKALQLHQQGKLPEAISFYEQILALSPRHSEALQGLGACYAQQNSMEKALEYFKQAIQLTPLDDTLHNNLGNTYKALKNYEKAIHHYREALRISPHYAQAHNNIATLFTLQDNYHDALRHYSIAVNTDPCFIAAHYNLGLLLLRHNELKAAAHQFKNVLALQPGHLDAHFYSGVLHLEANRLIEAEHDFKQVLAIDKEHINALINLGVTALKNNQGQLAVEYFTRALVVDVENTEARNNLAATFIHHDRYENALIHYAVLLKKEPQNIDYLYNSGVAQMALGHLQEAQSQFEAILTLENNHFGALNNLAAVHSRLGQRDKAIALLKRAIAVNPDDSACRFMLNALTGEQSQPEACPEYITNLFNRYALNYESHMQTTLHYSLPHQIARILHPLVMPTKLPHAIDLGCGTGLTGIVMREICEVLTGVDLSEKMLASAKEKSIYDRLVQSELITFLQHDTQQYQLAVAADVIPYLGELETLFSVIKKRLAPNGIFIFTTEISLDERWKLQSSARFSHHETYIKSLLQQQALTLIHQEKIVARIQDGQPLNVMIYAAKAT